jgi:phosphoribosylamine-glycine ligase
LDIETILHICQEQDVEAVHPGYGFLSENDAFCSALELAGIKFIGPTVENLRQFGDKTAARDLAIAMNIPVIAGSEKAFLFWQEAKAWIRENTMYPVIIKAGKKLDLMSAYMFIVVPNEMNFHSSSMSNTAYKLRGEEAVVSVSSPVKRILKDSLLLLLTKRKMLLVTAVALWRNMSRNQDISKCNVSVTEQEM